MIEQPYFLATAAQVLADLTADVHCTLRRRQHFESDVWRDRRGDFVEVDQSQSFGQEDRNVRAANGFSGDQAIVFGNRFADWIAAKIVAEKTAEQVSNFIVPVRATRQRNQLSFNQLIVLSVRSVHLL